MTDPYASAVSPEDITDDASSERMRLEQQADAIIAEGPQPAPIHVAVREDAAEARAWADDRVKKARAAIRDEPLRASLYALGIGVIIGLLAAR